jgi:hypothetical protein
VVVDDELRPSFEDVGQPDRAVLAFQHVVRHLHHRQAAALGGDRVELTGRRLLPGPQLVELALPGRGVDNGRKCSSHGSSWFPARTAGGLYP